MKIKFQTVKSVESQDDASHIYIQYTHEHIWIIGPDSLYIFIVLELFICLFYAYSAYSLRCCFS